MMNNVTYFAKTRGFAFKCTIIGVVLAIIASACLIQLAYIQLLNGQSTAQAATASRTLPVTIKAKRGRILDTNGSVLAQSVERYTIIANPAAIQGFIPTDCSEKTKSNCHQIDGKPVGARGAAGVARLLAPVLGMNAMELGAKLSGSSQYAVIQKDVTPSVKRAIDDLNLGGYVYAEPSSERLYTDGVMLGSLLGGVDASGKGVAGVEQLENAALTGTDGYKVYQQGNGGEEIPGTLTDSKDAANGADVTLTIDSDVDWYVKQVLSEGMTQYRPSWAIAEVLDLKTGNILALEDNTQVQAGSDQAKMNVSRAVSQTFEPGSIGKVFSMAGMLQTGVHRLTDPFTVPDSVKVDGQTYRDSTNHPDSRWTLAGILEQSSNVGMVMAGDKYPNDQRYAFLRAFGFGRATGMKLPGESAGSLTAEGDWDKRTRNTVLFGQGYATNIMQLTNAVATIANKGIKPSTGIVKSVSTADGGQANVSRDAPVRVVSESVAANMLNAMESSADHYSSFAGIQGYRVAAKSGTAQVPGADGRLTSVISDWSGIIPADNPRFVVTVVMKDPQGTYGGLTSGPLFKKIGEFLMQKYEVPTSSPRKNAIAVDW